MTNMTFVPDSVKVYSDDTLASDKLIADAVPANGITVGDYDTTKHTQNLQIKLDYTKVHPTVTQQSTVYVTYQAVVHKDASVDNVDAENVAKLVYSNNASPNTEYTTPDSKTEVDLFELKLYKTDESGNALSGAGFTVYGGADQTTQLKFSKNGNDYHPDTNGTITELTTGDDGYIHIVGLDIGTYKFVETTVPAGYYAPNNGFLLTLVRGATKDILASTSSFTAISTDDSSLINTDSTGLSTDNKVFIAYLKNSTTPVLPSAGGTGTVVFTIVGLAMMAAAGVIVFARKKNLNVK
jgi:LPXTG-motif cell wall-anchored protein